MICCEEVCMYVCMYVCACICMCVYVCIYLCIDIHITRVYRYLEHEVFTVVESDCGFTAYDTV